MNNFKIFDKSVFFVGSKTRKINGIGVAVFYFNRLTKTSMLPIEIIAMDLGKDIMFFCSQLNEFTMTQDDKKAAYLNSIIFDKEKTRELLAKVENEQVDNPNTQIFKDIFDIDVSKVEGIEGLTFDRIIYTENFNLKNSELVADGYIFVFTDMALRKSKLGFFAGNLRNKKYNEFVQELNGYGYSNILNEVTIKQEGNYVTVKNNTRFHIEIQPYMTSYEITPEIYGDNTYKRKKEPMSLLTLRPFESFELHHDISQYNEEYSLIDNIITKGYKNDSFARYSEAYVDQERYVRTKPYEFEIKRVGLEPVLTDDIDDFLLVTGFTTIDKLDDTGYNIIAKDNEKDFSVKSKLGEIVLIPRDISEHVTPEGMTNRFVKGFSNSMLLRLDSSQYAFDYSFRETETFITELSYTLAFNNTTSEYVPSLLVKTSTIADYNDFESQNTKVKIDKKIYDARKLKFAALPYLMKSDLFMNDVLMIDLNEISDMDSRPAYGHYIFKSFVKELDDVIEEFMKKRKQAVSNFKFMDFPLEVSSTEISEVSPKSNIWRKDSNTKETNDFVYNVKQHLSDLGYEIALEEALKKLKRSVYVFTPVKNVIATNIFGVSLDKEWYFVGSNWYKKEEIENPKITTFINDKIKEYKVAVDKYRFMYVKKIFFGYDNDTNEMISYAKAFAECIGMGKPIPSDLLIQNAAIAYIMEHAIDNERSYPEFREVVTYPAEFLNKYKSKKLKNKYVFPNIFRQSYNEKYLPGLYSSARSSELHKYIKNNALDVLDSVEKIEISTSEFLLFDHNALKGLIPLFEGKGYQILGIEDKKYAANAVVDFEFKVAKDIYIDGYGFDFGIEIYIEGERRFGMYYNMTTKKTLLFTAEEVYVIDYAFVVSLFDSCLLYNIDEINGYKFKELGVFQPNKDIVDNKYIYLPLTNPVESNYNLYGISINYLNHTFFLNFTDKTSETFLYDLVKGVITKNTAKNQAKSNNSGIISVSAFIDKKKKALVISKQGNSISVPLVSLRNLPTKTILYNTFSIKPYRLTKFLPGIYSDKYLTEVQVKVEYNDKVEYTVLKFGEPNWVDMKGKKVMLSLDGNGISYSINVGEHLSDLIQVYSLEEIFNKNLPEKDTIVKINVLSIEGGLL